MVTTAKRPKVRPEAIGLHKADWKPGDPIGCRSVRCPKCGNERPLACRRDVAEAAETNRLCKSCAAAETNRKRAGTRTVACPGCGRGRELRLRDAHDASEAATRKCARCAQLGRPKAEGRSPVGVVVACPGCGAERVCRVTARKHLVEAQKRVCTKCRTKGKPQATKRPPPVVPAEPTYTRPGSEERIRVYEERDARNEQLFHPGDLVLTFDVLSILRVA